MNATQQQRVLQGLIQASETMAQSVRALVGGNGGVPTVPGLYLDFLPPSLRSSPRDYFGYGVDFLSIAAAGGSASATFTVQNDSDFLITALAATVVDPDQEELSLAATALTIRITDGGSGRELFNRAQGFSNVVGTGQLPFFLPYPKFIDRASDVTTTLVNNHPTEAVRVRLTFHGFKIFDMMKGSRS